MPFPEMTESQRKAALERAAQVRSERAALKKALKDGSAKIADVLTSDDDVVGKTKVAQLINALPGYGKARTAQLMDHIGIAENRRVAALTDRQRDALIKALS